MNQSQLDRAVARTTGESLETVNRMCFSIADPESVHYDPEPSRRPPWLATGMISMVGAGLRSGRSVR